MVSGRCCVRHPLRVLLEAKDRLGLPNHIAQEASMSAQGTTDAVGAHAAPSGYSVRDLLAAGLAASVICTPPEADSELEPVADDDAEDSDVA
jgi:hypothetical protein